MKTPLKDEIFGYVERITFQNPENGYTVAQLQQPKSSSLTCIVGHMPGLRPGELVRCRGSWKQHLIHGSQFEVESHQAEAPVDLIGIERYLGSGLIKGIGPAYAKRILAHFGLDTLTIIDQSPERLHEVAGIGKKRIEKIGSCWKDQKSIREVMIALQSLGVSPAFAQKIFKTYGQESLKILKQNPFALARDIHGIGFKTADTIAQKMGIAKDAVERVDAGILYVLSELGGEGHVCYPETPFLEKAQDILAVDISQVSSRIEALEKENVVTRRTLWDKQQQHRTYLWSKSFFMSESGIARELARLQRHPCTLRQVDDARALSWVQEKLQLTLAPHQQEAVRMGLSAKASIITGGPGTGKSTITKAILAILSKLTDKIVLAAPTGKAAKRLAEITEKKARTIHSLLSFDFKKGGFKHNKENPLEADLVIVDEASMIDTLLMYSLLKAIPSHARLILIGDVNQLPSVGPGNVLSDLIDSHQVPVTTLKEIFRQAADSQIIVNAHRINQGQFPHVHNSVSTDFFFIEEEEPLKVLQTVVSIVVQRLPNAYGFHPLQDIQVLVPMRKGVLGIENFNLELQKAFNHRKDFLQRQGRQFLVGDKVMQIRNNYTKEVFNGDVGFIEGIDMEEEELSVLFDDKIVVYEFSELDELVLAYAVSVHKYQGSECPCVVIPVHTNHFMMLNRHLLYTAVTRGKKRVVLVGTKKALAIAVKNVGEQTRHTGLPYHLAGVIDGYQNN